MRKTLAELAAMLGGVVDGDGGVVIEELAGMREAGPTALSFIANEKYVHLAKSCRAAALVVSRDLQVKGFPLIRVADPGAAWGELLNLIKPAPLKIPPGVHPRAVIGEGVRLGAAVSVMACAVVMDGAAVGDRTVLYPFVYVGHGAQVGKDCLLYPSAAVRERVVIGDRVTLHAGAVVGSDGFGYTPKDGRLAKQEQFGTVVIEDDVEIGANVTIDRARFHETRVGAGSKIDNLVQIAHNVQIGADCILVSQVGIAGSARLGNRVTLAGQVGVVGHVTIGDGATVGAQSGVPKDLPAGAVVLGSPAVDRMEKMREIAAARKLPELVRTVRELKERVARLEAQSGNH